MHFKSYLSFLISYLLLSNFLYSKEKTAFETGIDKRIEKNILLSEKNPDAVIFKLRKLRDESVNAGYSDGANKCSILIMRIIASIKNDYSQIIQESNTGLKIAKKTGDNFSSSFHHMYRGIAYNGVGLIDLYFDEMKESLNYSNKVIDINDRNMLWASIYLNLSVIYLKQKKDTINHNIFYNKSLLALNAVSDTSNQAEFKSNLTALNYYELGRKFLKTNHRDSSEFYYLKAYEIGKKVGFSLNNKLMFIYSLGDFYLDNNDLDSAIEFAKTGLNFAKDYYNPQVEVQFYKLLHKSYLQSGQIDSSKFYYKLYSKAAKETQLVEDSTINKTLDHYTLERNLIYKYNIQKIIYFSVSIVLIISLGVWYWAKVNNRKVYKSYETLIAKLNEGKYVHSDIEIGQTKQEIPVKEGVKINDETIINILKKLDNFEKSNKFTQKDLSLGGLAHDLNTNTRYLSDIIREYRKKNFNSYINDLRIRYATQKLYSDPQYRKYKIAYLAEFAGFSSGSVFSTIFKNETGMTPSYFINQLKKNEHMIERDPL